MRWGSTTGAILLGENQAEKTKETSKETVGRVQGALLRFKGPSSLKEIGDEKK